MKKAILIYLLTLTAITVYPQKWEHTIGEPSLDESSERVIEHYDMGYLITAFLGEGSEQHGWLVKTDINGNVLWDITIGVDPERVLIDKTVYDEQGNLYVFGLLVQDFEAYRPMALKLNACGELLWCRKLYFEEYEYGAFQDAIMLKNGNLLALASMPDATQHEKIFLFCISPEGDYKWKKSYASKDDYPLFGNRLGSRIQFFDDIYIISGYVYSPHPDYPTITSIRPMFIGIDTLFNEQWVLEFGLMDNVKGKAYDCISLNDTLFMGVGTKRFIEDGEMINNSILMFFNEKGIDLKYNVIQNENIGPSINSNFIFDIDRINDSLFVTTSAFGSNYEGNPWGEFKIDTSGTVIHYETRDNTSASSHITKTVDDKYTIATSYWYPDLSYDVYLYKINENLEHDTVYPGNYTYDSLCTELPIQSGTIDLTGCSIITNLDEIPWLEGYNKEKNTVEVKVYPNPVEWGEVRFEYLPPFIPVVGGTLSKLVIYNVFGELVYEEMIYPGQGVSVVDVGNWGKGIYLGVIYSNGLVLWNCKFLIK